MEDATRASPPAHLWIVAIVGALWNGFGVYDFVMTVTANADYLDKYGPEEKAYFMSFPSLVVGLWALGVWAGLAGSLLLLVRSKHAVTMFALALAGLFVTTLYQLLLSSPPADLTSTGMLLMVLLSWAIAIALFGYARDMQKSGLLGKLS